MAYSSLGEHEQAIAFLTRLLNDYPDYRRPRVPGFPEYDRPVRGSLLHLRLYHASLLTDFSAIKKPLEFLGTIAASGADALSASGAADPGSDFGLSYAEPTPDQLRVAALPTPQYLVAQIHNKLLPEAIKTTGAKAVREYLRGLTKGNGPFASYASFKLISIDREIVAQYQAEAKKAWGAKNWGAARAAFALLMGEYAGTDVARQAQDDLRQMILAQYKDEAALAFAANNFDGAKGAYRRVMAEYPDSDDAVWAEGELKKIVPVAVRFYKSEGDKNYRPGDPDQWFRPQTKAREFFEKMLKEDPEGPGAPYALLMLSKTLGTEGKILQSRQQAQLFAAKYPDDPLLPRAMYQLAFALAFGRPYDYEGGAKWFHRVSTEFPQHELAPEALWHEGWALAHIQHLKEATVCMESLILKYPQSGRSRHAPRLIGRFKNLIATGKSFP